MARVGRAFKEMMKSQMLANAVCPEHTLDNICAELDPVFGSCATVLGLQAWRDTVCRFLTARPQHVQSKPQLPRSLLIYLQDHPAPNAPAWLADMAQLAWAQWTVGIMAADVPSHDPRGDLMTCPVVLNPACLDLAFEWPVHRIMSGDKASEAERTQLLVCRDAHGVVRVWPSRLFTSQFLNLLKQGLSGHAAALAMARWFKLPQSQEMLVACQTLLAQLRQQGVVLGAAYTQV